MKQVRESVSERVASATRSSLALRLQVLLFFMRSLMLWLWTARELAGPLDRFRVTLLRG